MKVKDKATINFTTTSKILRTANISILSRATTTALSGVRRIVNTKEITAH